MGWTFMGAREIELTNTVNKLEYQLGQLNNVKKSASNKMGNYQRLMNFADNQKCIADMFNMHNYINGGSGVYESPEYNGDWEKYFWPYAELYMVESDIDAQIKQLETQLQVARKELENVSKGKEADMQNGIPKYA